MNDNGNQNSVVEAKSEYTKNLKIAMMDVIMETMFSMYEDATRETEQKNEILMTYQKKYLKKVLDWSNNHVNLEVEKIQKNCSWFNDLLTAVIVTNVKILTSVKVSKTSKKVEVKMPSTEKFVHQVYIHVARAIFNDPFVVSQNDRKAIRSIIDEAIDETIRKTVPIQNILQNYVGDGMDSDEEEPEEDESDEEPEEEEDEKEEEEEDEDEDKQEDFEDGKDDVPDIDSLTPKPEATPTATSFFDPPVEEVRNVALNPQPNPMAQQMGQPMQQPMQQPTQGMMQPQVPQQNPTLFDDVDDP